MSKKKGCISLQGFLVNILLKSLVRKTLFGKRYIPVATYLLLLQIEYETGAILGLARRNKLDILKKMLSIQGLNFDNVIKDIHETEKTRLDKFKKEHIDDPKTFANFIYWPFWETATGLRLDDLYGPSDIEPRERKRKRLSKIIQNKLGVKIPFEEAQPRIGGFLLGGLGFGSTFPELTTKMLKNMYVYKKNNEELWNISRALGFSTPEDIYRKIGLPAPVGRPPTLKEKENMVLGTVAFYTSQYYPELLDPLDLRGHLSLIENLQK
jgi:hypothetical protein